MAKQPKFDTLEKLFSTGKDFELTDAQYEKKTGTPLPKSSYYLVNKSALARRAKEKGYQLKVIEKRVILTKKG